MRARFSRPSNFEQLGQKYAERAKRAVVSKLTQSLEAMQQSILQTPVYTGRTLINFHWSVGSPVETERKPVPNPARPGTTSNLAIGQEPRRQAQQIVLEFEFQRTLEEARRNPYRKFYLTNTSRNFNIVEYGQYKRSRTPPGGMTRRGEGLITVILGSPSDG